MNDCLNCNAPTKTKFCTKSCAASFNNRGKQKNKPVERDCQACGKNYVNSRSHRSLKYCPDCKVPRRGVLRTHKRCPKCNTVKSRDLFYVSKTGYLGGYCKPCSISVSTPAATRLRQERKLTLVMEFDNKCHDCGYEGPPFMFDFDHRNPEEKTCGVGDYKSLAKMREEALKCDLVCANCHRMRTHIQRCSGCIYCQP